MERFGGSREVVRVLEVLRAWCSGLGCGSRSGSGDGSSAGNHVSVPGGQRSYIAGSDRSHGTANLGSSATLCCVSLEPHVVSANATAASSRRN